MKRFLLLLLLFCGGTSAFAQIIPDNRRIVWQGNVGVEGGIPPRTTIARTLSPVGGGQDDTGAIQAALNNCPAGQTVKLSAGTFTIAGTINMMPNVTLRGSGPGNTIINKASPGDSVHFFNNDWGGFNLNLAADVPAGATQVTYTPNRSDGFDVANLNAGNYIQITKAGGDNCVSPCEGLPNGGRTVGQMVKVTAIDRNAKTVTFAPALFTGYSVGATARIEWRYDGTNSTHNALENAGLEDLTIVNLPQSSGLAGRYAGNYTIYAMQTANCWIRNVETVDGGIAHMHITTSYRFELRDSYAHGGSAPVGGGGSGYGYLFEIFDTGCLLENCIADLVEAPIVLGYGISGNVFGYNYVHTGTYGDGSVIENIDISVHSAHTMFNLFEGNVAHKFEADNFHGGSEYITAYRNWFKGHQEWSRDANWAVAIDANNYSANFVGNVLGDGAWQNVSYEPGSSGRQFNGGNYVWCVGFASPGGAQPTDNMVASTLLRHGNYDVASSSQKWDPNISERNLPASCYLTSKPAWFRDMAWPPVDAGSGVPQSEQSIPAAARFANPSLGATLQAPGNLRVVQ